MSNTSQNSTIKPIRPIDLRSVHQITSGQVVVDLQTAVKELLENSLDAGSNTIDVKFKEYGLESIRVSDDGTGIREEDLSIVALNHYTSKLSSFEGLNQVKTFGFRGEALSSLCALANVTIQTSTAKSAPRGWELEFDRMGKMVSKKPCSRPQGTTVLVKSLFQNLPVRRKQFVKDHKRHFNQALTLLQAYGLISINLNLNVSNQSNKGNTSYQFQTKSNNTFKQNFSNIFTPKSTNLIIDLNLNLRVRPDRSFLRSIRIKEPFNESDEIFNEVVVEGLISRPSHGYGRNSSDRQFFYINGRPFNPNKISKCVNEVYKQFNTNQYPVVLANFILPEDSYDVNVDPNKRTIFLHSESNLIQALKPHRSTFSISQLDSSQTTLKSQPKNLFLLPSTSSKRKIPENDLSFQEDHSQILAGKESLDSIQLDDDEDGKLDSQNNLVSVLTSQPTQTDNERKIAEEEDEVDKGGKIPINDSAQSSNSLNWVSSDQSCKKMRLESPLETIKTNVLSISQESQQPLFCSEEEPQSVNFTLSNPDENSDKKLAEENFDVEEDVTEEENIPLLCTPAPPVEDKVWIPSEMRSAAFSGAERPTKDVQMTLDTSGARWNLNRENRRTPLGSRKKKVTSSSDRLKSSLQRFVRGGGGGGNEENFEEDEGQDDEAQDEDGKVFLVNSASDDGNGEVDDLGKEIIDDDDEVEEDDCTNGFQLGISANQEKEKNVEVHQEPKSRSAETRKPEADLEISQGHLEGGSIKKMKKNQGKKREEILSDKTPRTMVLKIDLDEIKDYWRRRRTNENRLIDDEEVSQKVRQGDMNEESLSLEGAGLNEIEAEEVLSRKVFKEDFELMKVIGQFNLGFIIVRRTKDIKKEHNHRAIDDVDCIGGSKDELREDDLFIIDQHASDEKFNYEKLQRETKLTGQRLLTPKVLNLTAAQELTAIENLEVLEFNGFGVHIDESLEVGERVKLIAQPVWGGNTWDSTDFEELLGLIENRCSRSEVIRTSKIKRLMASRACRMSCMIGDCLNQKQMGRIVRQMGTMNQPWACPHGRPTMRWLVRCDKDLKGQLVSDDHRKAVQENDDDSRCRISSWIADKLNF
ncbi:hypothetical protein PPACK8108_LOCUS8172 [Phakopsora pachyrhizi]|uniref:DNA mismatch repair protein PMS1 n=1 Tax=Phakopsora pachyrhizi TaxID=170000 RepID=A0AAV0AUA0_PHAPC|nr:hypothetical protein PPACK8108_LOCUS8172 [Phakopsora pachyrhizi]